MGCANSKQEGNEALFLCKERVRFIKEAIESRYALSAAQLSYTQSLHNVGVALRQFAECDTLVESSLSTSEPDKTPSHSSYASPSPSRITEHVVSPRNSGSPLSPRLSNTSYMRATASSPLNFTVDSSPSNHFVEEEPLTFPFPPPPPPPLLDNGFSWDFFDPIEACGNAKVINGGSGINQNFSRLVGLNHVEEESMAPIIEEEEASPLQSNEEFRLVKGYSANGNANEGVETLSRVASAELSRSKREKEGTNEEVSNVKEDASKFITHRAKDFVSSMKDIEHHFNKAAESCHEVSRMLETKKVKLTISTEIVGKSSASLHFSMFHPSCCSTGNVAEHGTAPHATKVITWNRSISSQSSSSRNPLVSASKDDCGETCSDFIEEFCMISGSHSSTLDRLYAWERKLYDEVKASESIRKEYDKKCAQLRHQFAKDVNAKVIDKTRATVKDFHSQVRVAIQTVDSISKRIEKLRDDELQPQLMELIHGLIRMWKAMLECHHAQHITISLAYDMKTSTSSQQTESYEQAITRLQNEIECFTTTFKIWVDAQNSYIQSLNAWLQKCILPPQEKSWRKRVPFSPHRAIAPPVFILSADWLAGINSLPSEEVTDSLKRVMSNLNELFEQQREQKAHEGNTEEKDEGDSNCLSVKTSLRKLFDQMTKFSMASTEVYEKVKQGTEQASEEYSNGGRFRFQQGAAPLPV